MAQCKHFNMCRLEGLDTLPDGDSFCILHSPNPEKSESSFIEALKSYLQRSGNAPFPDFVFPKLKGTFKDWFGGETSGVRVNFSKTTFLGDVDFTAFHFRDGAGFDDADFQGSVSFHNARFVNAADFSNAHFHKEVSFLRTTFMAGSRFDNCRFDGPVYFGVKKFDFRQAASFSTPTSFQNTQFNGTALFAGVIFSGHVNFDRANFAANADFSHLDFIEGGSFALCSFRGKADFAAARFRAVVTFRGNSSERVFCDEADFTSVFVEKSDTLRFVNVNLRRAYFLNADVRQMEFVGVEWCSIGRRRGIYEETVISKHSGVPSLPDLEKPYRQLKQNYEERRDFGRAGDFHVGEKEMQLRNPNTPPSMRVMLALYKITNGYGESFLKPLCWFIGLWVCVAAMSLILGIAEKPSNQLLNIGSPTDWVKALLFSLNEAFHLRAEYFGADGSVRWLQTLSGILGPLFIALFGLAVRNRLRR